jgi:hypothetical protein
MALRLFASRAPALATSVCGRHITRVGLQAPCRSLKYIYSPPKQEDPESFREIDNEAAQYNRVGRAPLVAKALLKGEQEPVHLKHDIDVAPQNGPHGPTKFAVVMINKQQFKVVEGDLVNCHEMRGLEVGSMITLDNVLLVGGLSKSVLGQPLIRDATVLCLSCAAILPPLAASPLCCLRCSLPLIYRLSASHASTLDR